MGPKENQFLVSTCTSGDGNVMLVEYWRNNAKCIAVNREPAAGVMRLTIVCQILYPYTAEAKGTKIIGKFGAFTAFPIIIFNVNLRN